MQQPEYLRFLFWLLGGAFVLMTGGGGLLLAWVRLRRDAATESAKRAADSDAARTKQIQDAVTLAIAPLRYELELSRREMDRFQGEQIIRLGNVPSLSDHAELKGRTGKLESEASNLWGETQRIDGDLRKITRDVERLKMACKFHHNGGSHSDDESNFP